ncbi:isoprenylcysteine carboxylmethyltransferase family protein [Neolewinella aurantiaca]|uniref:Isoprenylcysteine carboxylmethyltransferase family protein n=1 Tax=Neolewinella aurantiaca TaxID=2602767 RepID=A0A5C7FQS0_9BACT|nr:isoprenylcysteine carboxylmethyltransferase family protein [Neolewinella aurantiaca]TXF87045.1 isoprenylcysteine carboxylmethyltransferase family protein [Neolewinella aurantiaca]
MPASKTKDYFFVGIQLLIFGAYALGFRALSFSLPSVFGYVGLFLAFSGLCTGVLALLQMKTSFSPFPTPTAAGELVTSGLFAWSRHPIYTSILLVAFGFALYSGSGYRMLIGLALLVLFFFKSSYEEELLSARFTKYADYKKKTSRFGFSF